LIDVISGSCVPGAIDDNLSEMLRLDLELSKRFGMLAVTLLPSFVLSVGCTRVPAVSHNNKGGENVLRELDDRWSKTAGSHDLDGTLAFYAEDAIIMPGDARIVSGEKAIREVWAPMLAPNALVSWQVQQTEVARSGDLGYVRGVYQLVMKSAAGKKTTTISEHGKLLEIWKKPADGQWKCVIDNFSADAPPAAVSSSNME
jgi:ketosteroid isomerase-like protein